MNGSLILLKNGVILKNKIIEMIKNKKEMIEYGKIGRKLYEEDKEFFTDLKEYGIMETA